jgi:dienelactone hydrolase
MPLVGILIGVMCVVPATGCGADSVEVPPPAPTGSVATIVVPSTPAPTAGEGGQPLPEGRAPDHEYPVGTQLLRISRRNRPLPTSVWYPAVRSGKEAPAAEGQFPLVVFSHGLTGLPRYYAALLSRWASAGFVVIAPTYPHTRAGATDPRLADVVEQPADATAVITEALRPGRLLAAVDGNRIAAAGHSAGGITTVLLFTSRRDPRLVAGVVLAGTKVTPAPFTGPPAWLLFVHGGADLLVPYLSGRRAVQADPWPKAFLTLPGRGHVDPYLTPGTAGYDAVADTTVDFLRLALYGDRAAGRRMAEDAEPAGDLDSSLPTAIP